MKTLSNRPAACEPAFFSPQVTEAKRFYSNLNPPAGTKLAVVCGGIEHCSSDYTIQRKTFAFYAIEYVARGQGRLGMAGREYPLQPGHFFAYGPGVAHNIKGVPEDPLVKYFVNFAGTDALGLLHTHRFPPGSVSRVFPSNTAAGLFDEVILAGSHGGRRSMKLCTALLGCLLQKMMLAAAPHEETETHAFNTYQQCRTHIERYFLRLGTLRQIADECHASDAYLCRLFHRYDQETPYQYLLRLKINYAAERLRTPGTLVKQVANETGFADQFHFSRLFRKILGLSPAKFRSVH